MDSEEKFRHYPGIAVLKEQGEFELSPIEKFLKTALDKENFCDKLKLFQLQNGEKMKQFFNNIIAIEFIAAIIIGCGTAGYC